MDVVLKVHYGKGLIDAKERVRNDLTNVFQRLFRYHVLCKMIVDASDTPGYVLREGGRSTDTVFYVFQLFLSVSSALMINCYLNHTSHEPHT